MSEVTLETASLDKHRSPFTGQTPPLAKVQARTAKLSHVTSKEQIWNFKDFKD